MTYSQQRRLELRIITVVVLLMGVAFSGIAVLKDVPELWWVAASFFMLLPFMVRKASKSDKDMERERDRFNDFIKRHPFWWSILFFTSLAAGLWAIGGFISRMSRWLA